MKLSRVFKVFSLIGVVAVGGAAILVVNRLNSSTTPEQTAAADSFISSYTPRVLAIGYNPASGGQNLVDTYFKSSLGGRTSQQFEDYVFSTTVQDFKDLSKGRINFQIVKKINITDFPVYPDGTQYNVSSFRKCVFGQPGFDPSGCDQKKFTFNYTKWVTDHQICQIALQNNVDEIWMVSVPYIMAWETFMIGPDAGFGVNGGAYQIPGCTRHYIALNGTYDRPENVLHDYGHRVESTFNYLTQKWTAADKQRYWEAFSTASRYSSPNSSYQGVTCGNAHFAANSTIAYDLGNRNNHLFNCVDWKNFPNFTGITQNINCSAWGCIDRGWQKLWMGSIPSNPGVVTMYSANGEAFQFKKDWWWYILSAENAISFVKGKSTTNPPPPTITTNPAPPPVVVTTPIGAAALPTKHATLTTMCNNNVYTINVKWSDYGLGASGYLVRVDNNNTYADGYWQRYIPAGTTSTVIPTSFGALGQSKPLTLSQGNAFIIKVYYNAANQEDGGIVTSLAACSAYPKQ